MPKYGQGRTGPANIRTMFEAPLCLFPHVGAAKIFTNCSFMHEVKRKSTNSSVYKETGNPPGPLFSIFDSLARFLCSQYLNTNVTYISQIIRGLYILRPASWALFLRRPPFTSSVWKIFGVPVQEPVFSGVRV